MKWGERLVKPFTQSQSKSQTSCFVLEGYTFCQLPQEGDRGKAGLRVLWGSKDKVSSHCRKAKAALGSRGGPRMRLGMLRECANWFMCISPHPNVFLRGPVLHAGFIWMAPPASSSAVSSPGVLPMSSRSTEQPTLRVSAFGNLRDSRGLLSSLRPDTYWRSAGQTGSYFQFLSSFSCTLLSTPF